MHNINLGNFKAIHDKDAIDLSEEISELLLAKAVTTGDVDALSKQLTELMLTPLDHALSYLTQELGLTSSSPKSYSLDRTFQHISPRLMQEFQRLDQMLKKMLDSIGKKSANNLYKAFAKLHWWPVLGLPDEFYHSIMALIDQGQTRKVDKFICNWFSEKNFRQLNLLTKRWDNNPYFHHRRTVYRQALKAHKMRLYNLSVAALLPQIEGIAVDFLQGEAGLKREGKTAIMKVIALGGSDTAYDERIKEGLVDFLRTSTYEQTEHVLPSGLELNRHGVLHGLHTRYGTEANSLRAFLWLEVIYESTTLLVESTP